MQKDFDLSYSLGIYYPPIWKKGRKYPAGMKILFAELKKDWNSFNKIE